MACIHAFFAHAGLGPNFMPPYPAVAVIPAAVPQHELSSQPAAAGAAEPAAAPAAHEAAAVEVAVAAGMAAVGALAAGTPLSAAATAATASATAAAVVMQPQVVEAPQDAGTFLGEQAATSFNTCTGSSSAAWAHPTRSRKRLRPAGSSYLQGGPAKPGPSCCRGASVPSAANQQPTEPFEQQPAKQLQCGMQLQQSGQWQRNEGCTLGAGSLLPPALPGEMAPAAPLGPFIHHPAAAQMPGGGHSSSTCKGHALHLSPSRSGGGTAGCLAEGSCAAAAAAFAGADMAGLQASVQLQVLSYGPSSIALLALHDSGAPGDPLPCLSSGISDWEPELDALLADLHSNPYA